MNTQKNKTIEATQEAVLPILEIICNACDSDGGHYWCGKWVDCHQCHGAGYLLTESGKAVLLMLKHQAKSSSGTISWRETD